MSGESDDARVWLIHDDGRQFGPHTIIEMAMLYAGGSISGTAVVWQTGWPQWVPILQVIPQQSFAAPVRSRAAEYVAPGAITTPLLISAIGNIVVSLLWLYTCLGVVFAVPMIILCIFEFRLYANANKISQHELIRRSKSIAICEIVAGLANLVSLVCGILLLIHAPDVDRRAGRR